MSRLEEAQLVQRQLERELSALSRAQSFATIRMDKNIQKGNVNNLPYKGKVMKIMTEVVDDVLNSIMLRRNTSTLLPVKEVIKSISQEMDLSIVICDFLLSSLARDPEATISVVGRQLGHRIVRAYQMHVFIKNNKTYYEEMTRELNHNRIGSFDKIYNRFISGNTVDEEEMKYDAKMMSNLGNVLLQLICEHDDSFLTKTVVSVSKNRRNALISFNCDIYELMTEIIETDLINTFDRIPMVSPPRPWRKQGNRYVGGFLSEYLYKNTPIQLGDSNRRVPNMPEPYLQALNKLQETKWRVNPFMHRVIKQIFNDNSELGKIPRATKVDLVDIPRGVDNEEAIKELRKERRDQHVANIKTFSKGIGLLTALQQCDELKDDAFHFVHSLDYRGRLYCMSTGLSTQGADYIKALLQFHEYKEVGERGLYWLKVRAANTMGYDKCSLDDRVEMIDTLIERGYMEAIAKSPIDNAYLWTTPYMLDGAIDKISKPLQFLATCHELATAYRLKDPTKHMSSLPVGLDGSCNGSQHLAVLSNNERLAYAVNVLPDEEVHDAYQEVVDHMYTNMTTAEMFNELKDNKHEVEHIKLTINWLLSKFEHPPRDLTKRCVMTLAYGATYRGRMDFVREFMSGHQDDPIVAVYKNKMVSIITYMIDKSLNALAGEALGAMKFIQEVAAHHVKKSNTWIYTTPLGLEVDNFIPKINYRKIKFMTYYIRLREPTAKADLTKIKLCSSPNYVHSLDACHLIKVILASGLNDFMAIHDDIGVHPSDTDKLFKVIREQFIDLYKDKDYFKELSAEINNEIVLNKPNPLDIDAVLQSEYFFA